MVSAARKIHSNLLSRRLTLCRSADLSQSRMYRSPSGTPLLWLYLPPAEEHGSVRCLRTKKPTRIRVSAKCWHYLSSRQVTLQVLSARVSLTSVFGMGTGGPSQQSTPTRLEGLPLHLCQSLTALTACNSGTSSPACQRLFLFIANLRGRNRFVCNWELVTRTGFEPMLTA